MKEVLQYVFGRLKAQRPVVETVNGASYAVRADGTLGEPIRDLAPQWTTPPLDVTTLQGLADALHAGLDGIDAKDVLIQVVTPWDVLVRSRYGDEFGRRHTWASAKHPADIAFKFDTYYTPEDFIIKFRASFLYSDEAVKVQQLCSTVGNSEGVTVADDGISQEITIKAGTVTRSSVTLPADGIQLTPWRTFRDATPVTSKFLLRMKGSKDSLPTIALFEIDAQWKRETVNSVAKWLAKALPEYKVIA